MLAFYRQCWTLTTLGKSSSIRVTTCSSRWVIMPLFMILKTSMLLLSSLSLSNFYQLIVCLHRQDRERTDIFLIEDSSDKAFQALLLTDGSSTNAQGLPKEFTSTGSSGGLHKTSNVGSIFEERKPPGAPAAASAPASAAPPCPPAAATAKPAAAAAPAAASGPLVFSTQLSEKASTALGWISPRPPTEEPIFSDSKSCQMPRLIQRFNATLPSNPMM
jgi:hypothetical protein